MIFLYCLFRPFVCLWAIIQGELDKRDQPLSQARWLRNWPVLQLEIWYQSLPPKHVVSRNKTKDLSDISTNFWESLWAKYLGLSDLRVSIKLCRLSIGAVTPNWLSNLVQHTIDPLSWPKFWPIRFRLTFLLSIAPYTLKLKLLNARKFYNAGKRPERRLKRMRSVRKSRSGLWLYIRMIMKWNKWKNEL